MAPIRGNTRLRRSNFVTRISDAFECRCLSEQAEARPPAYRCATMIKQLAMGAHSSTIEIRYVSYLTKATYFERTTKDIFKRPLASSTRFSLTLIRRLRNCFLLFSFFHFFFFFSLLTSFPKICDFSNEVENCIRFHSIT